MIAREYMNNDVQVPKEDLFICYGCNSIYRAKEPGCPKQIPGRCNNAHQQRTARVVG